MLRKSVCVSNHSLRLRTHNTYSDLVDLDFCRGASQSRVVLDGHFLVNLGLIGVWVFCYGVCRGESFRRIQVDVVVEARLYIYLPKQVKEALSKLPMPASEGLR